MGERTGPLDPRNLRNTGAGSRQSASGEPIGDPTLSAAIQGQPTPTNQPYEGDVRLSDAVQGQPLASTGSSRSTSGLSPEGRRINEEMGQFVAQEDAQELGARTSVDQYADNDDDYDDGDDDDDDGGAYVSGQLNDGSETDNPDEIRDDIEQTRAQMSGTLDAIEAKLNPHRIAQQVTDTVKEATVGKAEEFMSDMSDRAQDLGSTFMDTLRENAVPAALIGLGLGWLMVKNNSANREREQRRYQTNYRGGYRVPIEGQGYGTPYGQQYYPGARYQTNQAARYQQQGDESGANPMQRAGQKAGQALSQAQDAVSDRMGDAVDNVQEAWGNVTDQAQETWGNVTDQAQRAQGWLQRTYQENPLMIGAIVLVAGAAIAFAIPETPQENQWMGSARDNLAQQAQSTVQETVQKTQQVAKKAASAAKDAAKDEAQQQQLTH